MWPSQVHTGNVQELEEHESELWAFRGLCLVGTLMCGMGVMNAYNTIRTVVAKQRSYVRARSAAKQSSPGGKKTS
jgi:hypothetical protein